MEPEALRELVERHQDRVYSLARYLCRDDATAADVAQESLLKMISAVDRFRGESHFDTWVYRIVVNTARDEWRRRRRFVPLEPEIPEEAITLAPVQEGESSRRQRAERLRGAIAGLSPKLRVPVVLRYLHDLSYAEIARVLRCSTGTVASRLSRAHAALSRAVPDLAEGGDA